MEQWRLRLPSSSSQRDSYFALRKLAGWFKAPLFHFDLYQLMYSTILFWSRYRSGSRSLLIGSHTTMNWQLLELFSVADELLLEAAACARVRRTPDFLRSRLMDTYVHH
jgi:hypothetical protein